MVKFTTSIIYGSALVAGVLAAPRPDSAIGDEVAVSAPNGTPITDTAELASQTSAEAAASLASVYSAASASDVMYTSLAVTDMSGSYMTDSLDMSGSSMTDSIDMSGSYMTDSSDMSGSYMTDSIDSTYIATSTLSTYESTSTISYGSGSSSWSSSSYDSCVQQCVAEFGNPMATYTPTSTSSDDSGMSSGSSGDSSGSYSGSTGSDGATHTVIVAPSQGVLRFVPFATNASVGDTIMFMWGANMHTVTKSSELSLCNKTDDNPFTSGVQNKSFVFTQVVNDTNPTFFYCGVPTHCEKGMFGIINPPNALSADTSIMSAMPSMVMNSSDVAAMAAYQQNLTSNSTGAASWGNSINMANMTSDQMLAVAENVMYTRTFLAANQDVMNADGSVDMSKASGPFMVPQDISAVLKDTSSSSSASPSASGAVGAAASGSSSGSAPSSTPKSGAGRSAGVSSALAGVVALTAALYAL